MLDKFVERMVESAYAPRLEELARARKAEMAEMKGRSGRVLIRWKRGLTRRLKR